jgi:restriction system protein
MPIPDYAALMLPILRLASGGEVTLQQAVERLIQDFRLTPEEAAQRQPSGKLVIMNRIAWARRNLLKAGLIEPRRASFQLTDQGRQLLANPPTTISRGFLAERYPEFQAYVKARQQRRAASTGREETTSADAISAPDIPDEQPATPDEQIDTAAETLTGELEADLLDRVRTVPPTQFEQIVVDLLIAMGFGSGNPEMGRRLGRTGDGGIDGVIHEDALGLDAVYIQAKRNKDGTIGAPLVQAFVGSLTGNRATKGVFVTSSTFSAAAKDYVRKIQQRVVLIDGEELARLLVRHGVGVREDRRIVIKKLDEDYFEKTLGTS